MTKVNEEKERAAGSVENRAKSPRNETNRASILETVVSMDLRQYTESGLADTIGKERISRKKQEDYEGLLPCHRWSCDYRNRCRFLHIPIKMIVMVTSFTLL